jgi:hypothetical protein
LTSARFRPSLRNATWRIAGTRAPGSKPIIIVRVSTQAPSKAPNATAHGVLASESLRISAQRAAANTAVAGSAKMYSREKSITPGTLNTPMTANSP